jgi:membrane-associated phospholipid phosphatase
MLKCFFINILFLVLICSKPSSAQVLKDTSPNDSIKISYVSSWLVDSKKLITSPFRWNYKQWITFGGAALITSSAYLYDQEILTVFQKNQNPTSGFISTNVGEYLGSGLYTFPLIAGFGIHGLITKNKRSSLVFLNSIKAYAFSSALVTILKYSCHRHRPYDDDPSNPYLWDGPSLSSEHKSFSSGHAMTAVTLLSSVALEYSDKKVIPVICYTLAATAALSRVYDNKHWMTDVLTSSFLGWGIAKLVHNNPWTKQFEKRKNKSQH